MIFSKKHPHSLFRKIALNIWNKGGDPSVYGTLEVDITESHVSLDSSPLPMVIKSISQVMRNHKELNSLVRFGKIYYRDKINISVLVNTFDKGQPHLSYALVENAHQLSVDEIKKQIDHSADLIHQGQDKRLQPTFNLIRYLPQFLTKFFLNLYSYAVHDLNLNLKFLRLPYDPFGSIIVSNVGSLGIQNAFLPLVPFTRATMMMAVGAIADQVKVINGEMKIRRILPIGITFDHRFFDGSHAAKMIRDFEKGFMLH